MTHLSDPTLFDLDRPIRHATARDVVRQRVEWQLRNNGPATPDEIAERLGLSVLSVRPACTALVQDGVVYKTGTRRPTVLGSTSGEIALVAP